MQDYLCPSAHVHLNSSWLLLVCAALFCDLFVVSCSDRTRRLASTANRSLGARPLSLAATAGVKLLLIILTAQFLRFLVGIKCSGLGQLGYSDM
jgi:hypothetical protein